MIREEAKQMLKRLDSFDKQNVSYYFESEIDKIFDSCENKVKEINELKVIQKDSLIDDYMIGLYNGLELASCTLENRNPEYITSEVKSCDDCKFFHQEWLCLELGSGNIKPKEIGLKYCDKWSKK